MQVTAHSPAHTQLLSTTVPRATFIVVAIDSSAQFMYDGEAFDIDTNTGSLSASTVSALPINTGELTADGLTLVHQENSQSTAAHVYHRASLTSSFSEASGSPINTP